MINNYQRDAGDEDDRDSGSLSLLASLAEGDQVEPDDHFRFYKLCIFAYLAICIFANFDLLFWLALVEPC